MYNYTVLFITFHCSLKNFMKKDLISHFYGVRFLRRGRVKIQ